MATRNIKKSPSGKGREKSLSGFFVRVVVFAGIVMLVVRFTDFKGYFNPDYTNDHTRRKWNAYYKFTNYQPVDVVLVGNSHLYTGVSPENLSNALGANCFILASPGTSITDVYFCLKEAVTVSKPKIAVVETFCINDYDSYQLKGGALSDQFKSFFARKNTYQKLSSTPLLFSPDNYLAAWSNTIRNHNFIFKDTAQISKNIKLLEQPAPEITGLYLGRYIRFTSGLADSTLSKYNKNRTSGYDYLKHSASKEAKKYLLKTIKLCEKNNVKLVLLTLPMYYKHVHEYEAYKKDLLATIASIKDIKWFDLQLPYDTVAFTPECFENTVSGNQHMTYYGSKVAAYKLASYIKASFPGLLPNRYEEINWKRLFYASDGYFENYPPENDGISQLLPQNVTLPGGMILKEMSLVPYSGGTKKLILKIDRKNAPVLYGKSISTLARAVINGQRVSVEIQSKCSPAYNPDKFYVFESEPLNATLKIEKIGNITLSENKYQAEFGL